MASLQNKSTIVSRENFAQISKIKQETRQLYDKLLEINSELQEHKMVLDTLKKTNGDRKCFRMI
ncbi:hypothetical protein MXB_549, partial [Myxobolus squamalis]